MENKVLQILNTANTKYKSYYPWTIFVREKITSLSVHKCVCVSVCVLACLFVKWSWLKLHLKSISWSDILMDYAHTGLWQQQQDVLTSTSVIVSCRRHFEDQITVTIRVAALSWHYQTLITKCLLSLFKKRGESISQTCLLYRPAGSPRIYQHWSDPFAALSHRCRKNSRTHWPYLVVPHVSRCTWEKLTDCINSSPPHIAEWKGVEGKHTRRYWSRLSSHRIITRIDKTHAWKVWAHYAQSHGSAVPLT